MEALAREVGKCVKFLIGIMEYMGSPRHVVQCLENDMLEGSVTESELASSEDAVVESVGKRHF